MEQDQGSDRIRKNLAQILSQIGDTRLVAVTKKVGIDEVRILKDAGHSIFGESRVNDAEAKILAVPAQWHMIGHLQSGKVKKAVELFDWIDSVDSEKIASRISMYAEDLDKEINVLAQVNIGGEPQKSGIPPEGLPDFIDMLKTLDHIKVRGIMAIAPFVEPENTRPYFKKMKVLFDSLQGMDTLSMGMSNDYAVALQEGSNMVRIGTRLYR